MSDMLQRVARSVDGVCGGDCEGCDEHREYRAVHRAVSCARRGDSPIDGVGPDQLQIDSLIQRVRSQQVKEVILR